MSQKPNSGHAGTISITIHTRRTSGNVMKPRIQCVLTQWNPDFIASGSGPSAVISPSGTPGREQAGRTSVGAAGLFARRPPRRPRHPSAQEAAVTAIMAA
jgi:hypothetical protein